MQQLCRGTGKGLYDCLKQVMANLEILPAEWKQKSIGLGCDGTPANVGSGELKGHLERDMPWIIVSWCLTHRLEFSIKYALKATFFVTVDEFQLQVRISYSMIVLYSRD